MSETPGMHHCPLTVSRLHDWGQGTKCRACGLTRGRAVRQSHENAGARQYRDNLVLRLERHLDSVTGIYSSPRGDGYGTAIRDVISQLRADQL